MVATVLAITTAQRLLGMCTPHSRLCRRGFARRIDGYLQYYGKVKNQEGMLRDTARVEGYRRALEAAELDGKTVLDIGTGSGILAFLSAKYGAKKVYAVEASPQIARVASKLSRANGFVGTVEIVPKHMEDITEEDIPAHSVDVIVSELFSHFLVGEIGLHVVTLAKTKFLRPRGLILPAMASLKLSPFEDKQLGAELRARHKFWQQRDYYGLDLTSVLPIAQEQALRENVVDLVSPDSLLVPPAESPSHDLDLAEPDDPSVWNRISFQLTFPRRSQDAVVDGLCGWWDVDFVGAGKSPTPVLSTGPDAPPTVWAQTRFMLDRPLPVAATENLTAKCDLRVRGARESYTLMLELVNHSTGATACAGPIELSNVYARHFASPVPFPEPDAMEAAPPFRSPLAMT